MSPSSPGRSSHSSSLTVLLKAPTQELCTELSQKGLCCQLLGQQVAVNQTWVLTMISSVGPEEQEQLRFSHCLSRFPDRSAGDKTACLPTLCFQS